MKQNIHFFLYLAVIFLTINSCSTSSDDSENPLFNDSAVASYGSQVLLRINSEVFESINTNRLNSINTGDSFKINSATRIDDNLEVSISYGGGCKQHSFEVIWDGVVYTDPPCQMNLFIIHNANNDECEALITETISINLKNLIGENAYKDSCAYNIFTSYNSTEIADTTVDSSN
ncbi:MULTISPECIES: hypothetical protein [Flavobacteriaceae]|uniref:Uncharacterized protein n=2 Tax=Flavobacteriaceae TaxID=49546 RepID=A0A4Y8AWA9_9FLAO|nr:MULTISPECIES: hypothetical protein [Flavobacteriaceae]TEW76810.1 hypothetical protein E2488_02895 [Gramella jeungdoensis]GGK49797.1 hypothetical protein GCM10007963_17720 [Lutibacter litoralis]